MLPCFRSPPNHGVHPHRVGSKQYHAYCRPSFNIQAAAPQRTLFQPSSARPDHGRYTTVPINRRTSWVPDLLKSLIAPQFGKCFPSPVMHRPLRLY